MALAKWEPLAVTDELIDLTKACQGDCPNDDTLFDLGNRMQILDSRCSLSRRCVDIGLFDQPRKNEINVDAIRDFELQLFKFALKLPAWRGCEI